MHLFSYCFTHICYQALFCKLYTLNTNSILRIFKVKPFNANFRDSRAYETLFNRDNDVKLFASWFQASTL